MHGGYDDKHRFSVNQQAEVIRFLQRDSDVPEGHSKNLLKGEIR